MKRIPPRPDLGHLKKQAKDLLASYRGGDPEAIARLRAGLPAAARKTDSQVADLDVRLHDAQSCLAREYGFASWNDLRVFVHARNARSEDPARALRAWLGLAYAGDIAGGTNGARPAVAARLLEENPGLLGEDPWLACAAGRHAPVARAIAVDPDWVHRPGGPLALPPLVAVAHSSLLRLPHFREPMHACARLLLDAGADPNQSVGNRWPPASLAEPAAAEPLSALYGAAGQNRDAGLAQMLLAAGADPNDGESLYHALESEACVRLLLQAGARVTGTNALFRVLDLDAVETLRLLLAHGADPNEAGPSAEWGTPLLWAIRRRRSVAHVEALLAAGADPCARTPDGADAHVLALRFGLPEVAERLRPAAGAQLPPAEAFVAACARADEAAARRIQSAHPDVVATLSDAQLRMLSELAAAGCADAVRLMVDLGWPIAAPGGDWNASALNEAVFRGDASLTRFLLERGAQWTEEHGYGDNVAGSLGWASLNEPVEGGDWVGCAEALAAHGLPPARPDPEDPRAVLLGGRRKWFSEAVTDALLEAAARQAPG